MPVHKHVIASLITITLVAFAYSATSIRNPNVEAKDEDSLASRVREYEYGGILYPRSNSRDECVLMLYSREQFEELWKVRLKDKEEYERYLEKRDFLEKKKTDAVSRGASANEISEINRKIRFLPRPNYGFRPSVIYCKIVCTGSDYVELKFIETPEENVLFPFHRFSKVQRGLELPEATK